MLSCILMQLRACVPAGMEMAKNKNLTLSLFSQLGNLIEAAKGAGAMGVKKRFGNS